MTQKRIKVSADFSFLFMIQYKRFKVLYQKIAAFSQIKLISTFHSTLDIFCIFYPLFPFIQNGSEFTNNSVSWNSDSAPQYSLQFQTENSFHINRNYLADKISFFLMVVKNLLQAEIFCIVKVCQSTTVIEVTAKCSMTYSWYSSIVRKNPYLLHGDCDCNILKWICVSGSTKILLSQQNYNQNI